MDYSRIIGIDDDAKRFLDKFLSDSVDVTAHTSGSTGKPKAIKLKKSDMRLSAKSTNQFFGINDQSILVSPLSCRYIAGMMMVVRAIESNSQLLFEKPSNAPLSAGCYPKTIDLLPVVPSQISGLLDNVGRKGLTVRNVIVGGAPMSMKMEQMLRESGINSYATYGMTETCSHVALRSILRNEDYFTALPGVKFSVDDDCRLLIHRNCAEIKTLHTNDVVRLLDDTRFVWVGRYDNVINSGGIKVHPEEIERQLHPVMGNRTFYLTSRSSEKWGEEVVMVVERGDELNVKDLMSQIKAMVGVKAPKEMIFVDAVERTSNGKIVRVKL